MWCRCGCGAGVGPVWGRRSNVPINKQRERDRETERLNKKIKGQRDDSVNKGFCWTGSVPETRVVEGEN